MVILINCPRRNSDFAKSLYKLFKDFNCLNKIIFYNSDYEINKNILKIKDDIIVIHDLRIVPEKVDISSLIAKLYNRLSVFESAKSIIYLLTEEDIAEIKLSDVSKLFIDNTINIIYSTRINILSLLEDELNKYDEYREYKSSFISIS